jgi:hypothetical protein
VSPEQFKVILDNAISDFFKKTLPWLFGILWNAYKPYIIGAISGSIVIGICVFIGIRITRFRSQVESDTKRETKRKERRTENTIRGAFSLHDLLGLIWHK